MYLPTEIYYQTSTYDLRLGERQTLGVYCGQWVGKCCHSANSELLTPIHWSAQQSFFQPHILVSKATLLRLLQLYMNRIPADSPNIYKNVSIPTTAHL